MSPEPSDDPPGRAALVLCVARAQSGDRQSLDRLLRDHQQPLYRHVRAILRDPELAYDVLQATLLIVARRLRGLRDPRWFKAWAFRIATREALRAARRRARDRALFDEEAAIDLTAAPAEAPACDPAWVRACDEALAALPPGAQLTLRLHYLEEMTLVEVAEALEIPLGTVKSRLAYGLARLRERMTSASGGTQRFSG